MLRLALLLLSSSTLPAAGDAAGGSEKSADAAKNPLAAEQAQVAQRYREFERVLIRMAEVTAHTDPRRAALLRQVIAQSKSRDIDHQFDQLIELLQKDRLSVGIKGQNELHDDLAKLLDLLLSEDRSKRIESEKQRLKEYLRRINVIIKEEQVLLDETIEGREENKLGGKQKDLAGKTDQLAKDYAKSEGVPAANDTKSAGDKTEAGDKASGKDNKDAKQGERKPAEGKSGDQKPGDKKDGSESPKANERQPDKKEGKEGKEGDDKAAEKQSGDKSDKKADDKSADKPASGSESKENSPKSGDPSGQPKEGQPQSGKPSQGQAQGEEGESAPQPPQPSDANPVQKRLQEAEKKMQDARRKLEEARRQGAAEDQQQAIQALQQAKAELEQILRQLREEERGRMLAMLESRFRKMLDMQIQVYEGTKRLDRKPEADRDRDDEIESGRLGRKEAEIAGEADRALAVLHEEGSAVAMTEAVGEMRDDMEQIVARLSQSKVGEMTQKIEEDVIAALEEMIAALQKAQKDLNDEKGKPGQGGQQDEQPLVDRLAELKVIRAMQMRVNNRTQRYSTMLKTEQAEQPDLIKALKGLAEREQRIYHVTRDIVVGRNQ